MPFPRFGKDLLGNQPMFIGETHTDTRSLTLVAWKLMWIHSEVHAIFIEHYPANQGPSSAAIAGIRDEMKANGMMGGSWLGSRPTLPAEIGQLKYQCDRYGIPLRGWDIPYKNNFERAMPGWNRRVLTKIWTDLKVQAAQDPKRYIIFGGGAHGDIMKNSNSFDELPLFKREGEEFLEVSNLV